VSLSSIFSLTRSLTPIIVAASSASATRIAGSWYGDQHCASDDLFENVSHGMTARGWLTKLTACQCSVMDETLPKPMRRRLTLHDVKFVSKANGIL
jgi:hypothetical protein